MNRYINDEPNHDPLKCPGIPETLEVAKKFDISLTNLIEWGSIIEIDFNILNTPDTVPYESAERLVAIFLDLKVHLARAASQATATDLLLEMNNKDSLVIDTLRKDITELKAAVELQSHLLRDVLNAIHEMRLTTVPVHHDFLCTPGDSSRKRRSPISSYPIHLSSLGESSPPSFENLSRSSAPSITDELTETTALPDGLFAGAATVPFLKAYKSYNIMEGLSTGLLSAIRGLFDYNFRFDIPPSITKQLSSSLKTAITELIMIMKDYRHPQFGSLMEYKRSNVEPGMSGAENVHRLAWLQLTDTVMAGCLQHVSSVLFKFVTLTPFSLANATLRTVDTYRKNKQQKTRTRVPGSNTNDIT